MKSLADKAAANSSEEFKPRPGQQLLRYVRWAAKRRTQMVMDLANLSDDDSVWFWRKWGRDYVQTNWNRPLTEYRDELRAIWSIPLSNTLDWGTLADVRLRSWLAEAHTHNRQTWVLRLACVYPDFRNLPLSLALALSELAPKMAKCENPECPCCYFLKGRKTQRFCDRPICIAYGQRKHKREWWKREGTRRRAAQSKARPKRNRKGRKGR